MASIKQQTSNDDDIAKQDVYFRQYLNSRGFASSYFSRVGVSVRFDISIWLFKTLINYRS